MNWLGFHFHLILLLFVPLYAIFESVLWFVLFQAFSASASVYIVYLIAYSMHGKRVQAYIWSLAFLFNPFYMSSLLWDFHPIMLSVPLCLLAYYSIVRTNSGLFVFSCLFLLTIRESSGLMVSGFGGLWIFVHRRWLLGGAVACLGAAYSIVVVEYLMPLFSPLGIHPMFSGGQGHLSRFGWLGEGVLDGVKNILSNPISIMSHVLWGLGGGKYLVLLLSCGLFLPLAAVVFMLPAAGELAVNLFSSNGMQKSIYSYHSAVIAPCIVVSSICGGNYLVGICKKQGVHFGGASLSVGVLFLSLLLSVTALKNNTWGVNWNGLKIEENFRQWIPAGVNLYLQGNLGGHYSAYEAVTLYQGEHLGSSDVALLHLKTPTIRLEGSGKGDVGTLSHHLQMDVQDFLESIECQVKEGATILLWSDNWLLLQGGGDSASKDTESVLRRLHDLKRNWLSEDVLIKKHDICSAY